MRQSVLILSTKPESGVSWWRSFGPFQTLYKDIPLDIEVKTHTGELDWSIMGWHDVVFFERPFRDVHLKMIEVAKRKGAKVWVDYDDNLLEIPFSNPAFKSYSDPKIRQAILKIVRAADMVSVSTKELARLHRTVNPNTVLVPNGWGGKGINEPSKKKPNDSKVIFWRGSNSHNEDVMEYFEEMLAVHRKFKAWKWIFLGHPPFQIAKYMKDAIVLDPIAPPEYFHFLNDNMAAEIGIVPLVDSSFNRCKSNIAWQEIAYIGAAPLCPQFEEWTGEAQQYSDKKSFRDGLEYLIQMPERRAEIAAQAQKELLTKFSIEQPNQTRLQILMDLLGRAPLSLNNGTN